MRSSWVMCVEREGLERVGKTGTDSPVAFQISPHFTVSGESSMHGYVSYQLTVWTLTPTFTDTLKPQLVQCWDSSAGGSRETFEELPVRGHWLPSQKSQVLLWFSAAGLRAAHPFHLHLRSPAFPRGSGPSVVTKAAASANCTLTGGFASTDQLYPPAGAAGFSGPALTQAGFMCSWQSPPFKEVWISAVPPGPWSFHCLSLSPFLSPEVAAGPLHLLLLLPWESHFTPLLIEQFCRLPPPFKELRWFCLLSGPRMM